LVLESALSILSGEILDSHDEIIDEFHRQAHKCTGPESLPFQIDDRIFPRGLHIVQIENNLAEVQLSDLNSSGEGSLQRIKLIVKDFIAHFEVNWIFCEPHFTRRPYVYRGYE
jgi:hypothetical protein